MYFDTAPVAFDTIIITFLLSIVIFLAGLLPVLIYRERPTLFKAVWSAVHFFLFCGFIVFCYLSVPNGYALSPDRIVIKRYVTDISIDYNEIDAIRSIDYFAWKGKNGWNPGVFGFVGTYRSKEYGRFSAYLTNWRYLVLIKLKDRRPIIISPDKPDIFVSSYKKQYIKSNKD